MASQRSTNTMVEVLQRMLQDIAQAKTLPDADLQFLISLETMILQKLKAPIDAAAGNVPGVQSADPTGGAGGGMPPGLMGASAAPMSPAGAPMAPAGAGAGVAGLRTAPQMPNPDELRRLVGGQ